jgi:hypothetical protein
METRQEYHLYLKGRFNTFLFQLFGNRSLVEMFVRFPICSAEQPAPLLKSFAQEWHIFRFSPEANRARENSRPNMPGEVRLSQQIYSLQQKRARGRWIADWIDEDWNNWYNLSHADRRLWTEHTSRNISSEITELQMRQQPRYPGAAEALFAARFSAERPERIDTTH